MKREREANNGEELLTPEEAAKATGYSLSQFKRKVAKGEIQSVELPPTGKGQRKNRRFRASDIKHK